MSLLHEVLNYDPITGIFRWRAKRCNGKIKVGAVAGYVHHDGYVRIRINGREYLAHRLAWLYMTGHWPSAEIDHKNRDRSDNRWANLRQADDYVNNRNQSLRKDNTSSHVGVHWANRDKVWIAYIGVNGRQHYLGCFKTIEEAAAARLVAQDRAGFSAGHGRRRARAK
jgi:hypothetical protein